MIQWPPGFHVEPLRRDHPRRAFRCGEPQVDDWLATKALQQQRKRLSVTRVLLDPGGAIAGYYTLAAGQVDFSELPTELTKELPRRLLPAAILAWFGVSTEHQGKGLGRLLLAQALHDCYEAGKTLSFVVVILDCLSEAAKRFYQQWEFAEFPVDRQRLYLTAKKLEALMEDV